jgi:hypothetical protein
MWHALAHRTQEGSRVDFYPLGTFPEAARWLAGDLEARGFDTSALPLWHISTSRDLSGATAILLRMPPGYVLFRHGHPCNRFEVVVQGSLELGDGRVAHPGDAFSAEPGELYGPHTAGPDGCTTFEIFSELDGLFRVLYEDDDGEVREANTLQGEIPPGYEPLPDDSRVLRRRR